jgi:mannosyl-oligosaccharide alpha-1,2-mannosidase
VLEIQAETLNGPYDPDNSGAWVAGSPRPGSPRSGSPRSGSGADGPKSEFVRDMMSWAWTGYETYAWGMDELNPVSKTGQLGVTGGFAGFSGLGATLVDAMSTLHLMEMEDEFDRAKEWVAEKMDFERQGRQDISFFETTIRLMGGLLSAYDLSGDRVLLDMAQDLGERIEAVFDGERSGILVNKASLPFTVAQSARDEEVLLAELGSNLIEWGTLGDRTGRVEFIMKAEAGVRFAHARNNDTYLLGEGLSRSTGEMFGRITMGAPADSYYEYLLKYWILGGKTDDHWRERWVNCMDSALRELRLTTANGRYSLLGEKRVFNSEASPVFGHLTCFLPGNIALGVMSGAVVGEKAEKYLEFSKDMMKTCYQLYNQSATGLGADSGKLNLDTEEVTLSGVRYMQRPEVVESLFYMWRATHDQIYRDWGWSIVQAIEKYCKVDGGYSGVVNVNAEKARLDDKQQSWFLAETLKYLYLLFSDDSVIDLDAWVFNTEAHPVRASIPKESPWVDWDYLSSSTPRAVSFLVPRLKRAVEFLGRLIVRPRVARPEPPDGLSRKEGKGPTH